jgi:P27 family predicted phage terminase small subunit
MSSPGTKRKTPALKSIDGSRSRNKNADKKAAALAKKIASDKVLAPGYLSQREMEKFDLISIRLKEINVLSDSFTEIQAICAQRLAQIEELSEVLEAEGMTYQSVNQHGGQMIKPHPAVAMRNDAMRHSQSLLSEMGLTHTAISKLAGALPPHKNTKKGNAFAKF